MTLKEGAQGKDEAEDLMKLKGGRGPAHNIKYLIR